ncbi:hypothetical protein BCR36DRAFT_304500, partial [Piromyces finnis]
MRLNLKCLLTLLVPLALAKVEDPCTAPGGEGVCIDKSLCKMSSGQKGTATTYTGYCKNDPANILCCVKKVTQLTNGTNLSKAGVCKNVSKCPTNSNTLYSNQCPGSSNVKLCVP